MFSPSILKTHLQKSVRQPAEYRQDYLEALKSNIKGVVTYVQTPTEDITEPTKHVSTLSFSEISINFEMKE